MCIRDRISREYFQNLSNFFNDTGVTLTNPIPESVIEEQLSEKGKTIWETQSKKAEELQSLYGEIIGGIIND